MHIPVTCEPEPERFIYITLPGISRLLLTALLTLLNPWLIFVELSRVSHGGLLDEMFYNLANYIYFVGMIAVRFSDFLRKSNMYDYVWV